MTPLCAVAKCYLLKIELLLRWLRNNRYIDRLLALIAGAKLILHDLSLIQGLEALLNNSCVVYEHLFAIFGNNKSIALLAIEPFYCAFHNKLVIISRFICLVRQI